MYNGIAPDYTKYSTKGLKPVRTGSSNQQSVLGENLARFSAARRSKRYVLHVHGTYYVFVRTIASDITRHLRKEVGQS